MANSCWHEMTAPPVRAITYCWQLVWSPGGIILAIIIWWSQGFPLPDWEKWKPLLTQLVASYWFYGALVFGAWAAWYGVRRLVRWWRDRPRERIVEKIVYRDRPVQQLQEEQPKRTVAEVITAEYDENVALIDALPLDGVEKRAAKNRAKIIMVKKLERHLR